MKQWPGVCALVISLGLAAFMAVSALVKTQDTAAPQASANGGDIQFTTMRSPNNIYAQLGIRGVTDAIHGTNAAAYYHYLVMLNSNGQFNAEFVDFAIPSDLNRVVFIDGTNGSDATNITGKITAPYKTFTNAIVHASNDTVFVFMPGTYEAPTVTNTSITNLTLVGWTPESTDLTGTLKFDNDKDCWLQVYRMTVDTIKQQWIKDITVGLYDRAVVSTAIQRQTPTSVNSWLTVNRDPSVSISVPISITNITDNLTHNATNMSYDASDTNDWYNLVPTDIAAALNLLADRLPRGTNAGEVVYWNGTRWVRLPYTGNPHYVLHGGPAPFWDEPLLNVPSNTVGQVIFGVQEVYAKTNSVFYPVVFSQPPVPVCTVGTNPGILSSVYVVDYDEMGFSYVVQTNGGLVEDPWPVHWHSAFAFSWLVDYGGYMFYTLSSDGETNEVFGVNETRTLTNACGEYVSTPGVTDMPVICTNIGFNIYWKAATSTVYIVNSGGKTNLIGTYYDPAIPGDPTYEACSDSNGFHQVWLGNTNHVYMISPNSAYQNKFGEFHP
jgi:hypothetical protein